MTLTVYPASFHPCILSTHGKGWAMTGHNFVSLASENHEYSILGVSVPVNVTSLSQWPKSCLPSWLHRNPHFCFLRARVCLMCAEDPAMRLKKSAGPGGCDRNKTVTLVRQMPTQEQNRGGYFDKSSRWEHQTATHIWVSHLPNHKGSLRELVWLQGAWAWESEWWTWGLSLPLYRGRYLTHWPL